MSTNQPKFSVEEKQAELDRQVEREIRIYQNQNDGAKPSRKYLSAALGKSTRDISPAMRRVEDSMLAAQTRIAAMPSMPVELREQCDDFLKALWATTKTLASEETKEARLLLEVRTHGHTSAIVELESIVGDLEDERDAAIARAEQAEDCNAELLKQLADLRRDLDTANARLEERDEILAMIARPVDQPEKNGRAKGPKTAKPATDADDPETGELPMVTSPARADGLSA